MPVGASAAGTPSRDALRAVTAQSFRQCSAVRRTLSSPAAKRQHLSHHSAFIDSPGRATVPASPDTLACMSIVSVESASLRAAIAAHRDAVDAVLQRYHAANPGLFGSVARGEATSDSDIDLLVDLLPVGGNELLRLAGIAEELGEVLGKRVDVVAASLLRGEVSVSALADTVAV